MNMLFPILFMAVLGTPQTDTLLDDDTLLLVSKTLLQGRAEYFDRNYEVSLGHFEEVLKIDPENVEAVLGRLDCRIYLKQKDEAILQAQEAFEPETEKEGIVAVHICFWNRDRDKAKGLIDELLKKFPESYMLYYQKGYLAWQLKQYDDAIQALTKSKKLNTKYPETYYMLGDACRGKGDIEGLIASWTTYLQMVPETGKRFEYVSGYLKGLSGR